MYNSHHSLPSFLAILIIGTSRRLMCANILVSTLTMCYHGIFKLTALVRNLFFIISRLSRLKPVLPSQTLMYICSSIIQPKIDYAISIWGYTTAHNINKVQRLQNRAARILTGNFDYVNTRGIDLVKNLGLMNVTQRRDYFMLIMMFKSIHGLVYVMRLLCSGTLL